MVLSLSLKMSTSYIKRTCLYVFNKILPQLFYLKTIEITELSIFYLFLLALFFKIFVSNKSSRYKIIYVRFRRKLSFSNFYMKNNFFVI